MKNKKIEILKIPKLKTEESYTLKNFPTGTIVYNCTIDEWSGIVIIEYRLPNMFKRLWLKIFPKFRKLPKISKNIEKY